MTERRIVVSPRTVHGDRREEVTLEWDESRQVLDELCGAPVDCGAVKLRALAHQFYWLSVVILDDEGNRDAGSWLPIDGLIRLAEFPGPEREAMADAFEAGADDAIEEGERRHQAAHSAGVLG